MSLLKINFNWLNFLVEIKLDFEGRLKNNPSYKLLTIDGAEFRRMENETMERCSSQNRDQKQTNKQEQLYSYRRLSGVNKSYDHCQKSVIILNS